MNGKRDMRKKFVKSSRPTYKKRIRKAQQGMRFVNYNVVENPTVDYKDITNPTNPFSEYNFNTTYNTPQGLVVPTREDSKPDTVKESPVIANNNSTVEPVVNKPVTKTAKSTWKSPYTNRKQWTTELINAYKKAGITNDNAIRMLLAQDALESSWGKSAQGKYNFGNLTTGSSWKGDYVTGNDKNAKGEAIKQKFRSYNSMDEYAADKIQFLKRLYDFDENDDINKFVAKLTGSNKGKRRYAEASNYAKVLTGVYNGIPKGKNGMIIRYQNPAHGIARRKLDSGDTAYTGYTTTNYYGNDTHYLPVTKNGNEVTVGLPDVVVTPRNLNIAGAVDRGRREAAPYVSTLLTGAIFGPLSVAGGYAGNEAVNKITNVASNGKYNDWSDMMSKTTGMNPVLAEFFNIGNLAGGFGMRNFGSKLKPVKDMAVGGNKWARARVISKAIDEAVSKGNPKVAMRFNKKSSVISNATSTTPRFNISKEALPDYAHPNWQGDQFALLKERLANGGFDRLERISGGKAQTDKLIQTAVKMGMSPRELNPYANDFSPAFRQKILLSEPKYGTAESFKVPAYLGGFSSRKGDYYAILNTHIAKHTPSVVSSTKAHELAHYTYNPNAVPPMSVYKLPTSNPNREYLMGFGTKEVGTELTARGTQIKGYYGLKEEHPITEDMLKYAADNYVKDTGYDNNMTDFFKGIVDYKEMAKWLTERSPLLILSMFNTKNNENGNNNR